MSKVFARQMHGKWFKVESYYDESGKRRQRSLGAIPEEEALALLEQGSDVSEAQEEGIGEEAPGEEALPKLPGRADSLRRIQVALTTLTVRLLAMTQHDPEHAVALLGMADKVDECRDDFEELYPEEEA